MLSYLKRLSSSRKQDLMVCLLGIGLVFVAIAMNS
jgi:hypothetical protein